MMLQQFRLINILGINDMLIIRCIQQDDFNSWCLLYEKYLAFYQTMLSEQQLMNLWDWFFDDTTKVYCSVAILNDNIIGLVHFREFFRPIKASVGIFMDDLFVDSSYRGQGIARQLIKTVDRFASEKNISIVRWITGQNNKDAMKVYDKLANKTSWIMYDMAVNDSEK
jgi:GNAT superfamily N-acetyltransferase